ncbi:DUF2515 family protein [Pseudomonas mangiferae]|uniref:Uncharacterized protein n=1 Tax=Pseudomonas mangiferae TaxID=2593654 RepID=A0A553GVA6_9PSED|nr:hypothetical protein [Pseudomonas mangiferae]TRX73413.1 hypothetical protein FM069_17570 [Pseudomonas mangiferae]
MHPMERYPGEFDEFAQLVYEAKLERERKLERANAVFRDTLRKMRADIPVYQCKDGNCCDARWADVMKEVNFISEHPDPIERNRQINALYADLYLKNPNQKWAATAAIVSKQVGCTMMGNPFVDNEVLGKGNVAIFQNIYPILKVYQTARPPLTDEQLLKCIKRHLVNLKEEHRKNLLEAIQLMMKNYPQAAALAIAEHEQSVVVQNAMWDDNLLVAQAWINAQTGEIAVDQSVYFTSGCDKSDSTRLSFPGDLNVSNAKDRVKFYKNNFLSKFDEVNTNPDKINEILGGIRNKGER